MEKGALENYWNYYQEWKMGRIGNGALEKFMGYSMQFAGPDGRKKEKGKSERDFRRLYFGHTLIYVC